MRYSELDPSIEIDQNTWAVSLICCKGGNHAEIIIEKITDDDQYMMQLTHFRGIPAVTFLAGNIGKVIPPKKVSPKDLKYDGKKTWSLPRKKVEDMISAIEREHAEQKLRPEAGTPFNIFGRDSVLPASFEESLDPITVHSTNEESFDRLVSATMFLATLGASIYTLNPAPVINYLGTVGAMKLKNEMEIKSAESRSTTVPMIGTAPFSIRHNTAPEHFDVFSWVENKLKTVTENIASKIIPEVKPRSSLCSGVPFHRSTFSNRNTDIFSRPHHKSARPGNQDNCFTWSREKLKIAGIILPKGNLEKFITVTRTYTNPGELPIKLRCS